MNTFWCRLNGGRSKLFCGNTSSQPWCHHCLAFLVKFHLHGNSQRSHRRHTCSSPHRYMRNMMRCPSSGQNHHPTLLCCQVTPTTSITLATSMQGSGLPCQGNGSLRRRSILCHNTVTSSILHSHLRCSTWRGMCS